MWESLWKREKMALSERSGDLPLNRSFGRRMGACAGEARRKGEVQIREVGTNDESKESGVASETNVILCGETP